MTNQFVLLIYRIPAHPTRLRLQIWRRLQRMGVVYLQDAVCALPDRPDLMENMQYVATAVEEMGGTCHLFSASALLPDGTDVLEEQFRALADSRLGEIVQRLDQLQEALNVAATPAELEKAEDDLKRERVAYLRARKLSFFGSTRETEVDERLDRLTRALDDLYRGGK